MGRWALFAVLVSALPCSARQRTTAEFLHQEGVTMGTQQSTRQEQVPQSVTQGFAQVASWIEAAAADVPADGYAFKPAEDVRSFGALIAHLVDSYNYYCRAALGSAEWADPVEKANHGKDALLRELRDATQQCTDVHARGRTDPLVENLAHTSLHYGNLIVYLRLLGIVPPSSR